MSEGKGRIGVPELLVGVPFPTYALEMLQLTLHGRMLEEFVYSGTTASAERALEVGLVDRVTPSDALETDAMQAAARLAAVAPAAFGLAKVQLRGRASRGVEGLGAGPDREIIEIWTSEESRTRIRDYLDRTIRK
jgi:enoyl-CoA hydratase